MLSPSPNVLPLPPSISLTPAMSHNRSRSGTLPASAPLPPMDLSASLSLSPHVHAVEIPTPQQHSASATTRRMRLGSLFSTSSIWNDDALLVSPGLLDNVSVHSASSGSFLSPHLQPLSEPTHTHATTPMGPSAASGAAGSRNRSYTTAGISNTFPQHAFIDPGANRLLNSSLHPSDMSQYLDTILSGTGSALGSGGAGLFGAVNSTTTPVADVGARNRAQTFSGSAPNLPEAMMDLFGQLYKYQSVPGLTPHHHMGVLDSLQIQQPQVSHAQLPQQFQHQHLPQQQQQPLAPQLVIEPLLQDEFDILSANITTNFESPSLGPTRSLLFDNLPSFIDSMKMWNILANSLGPLRSVGSVRSVRMLTLNSSKIALVECSTIEIAMSLKGSFNHLELVPGVVIYVAFVKFEQQEAADAASAARARLKMTTLTDPVKKLLPPHADVKQRGLTPEADCIKKETPKPRPTNLVALKASLIQCAFQLSGATDALDERRLQSLISRAIAYPNDKYRDDFGPLPEPIPLRQFDSPRLRELRKQLEQEATPPPSSGHELPGNIPPPLSQLELEEICLQMLDELPELCYDYLGNTIVQKIFTLVESPLIRLMMVKVIQPYLAQSGIHKNGTWAIQKIISVCLRHDLQLEVLIAESLRPYAVKLFNDQFGNYVLQGCLKFGLPFNDFLFEVLLNNFLEISYGRFGARSIRTILDIASDPSCDGVVSREQMSVVTALIVTYATDLVLNNNGSLLVTWLLDNFRGSDDRFAILTRKFLPLLDTLCCHKLANLTVLKIIHNRTDCALKGLILDAIFGKFNEANEEFTPVPLKLLETILAEDVENSAGPLFIYKILSGAQSEGSTKSTTRYHNFLSLQVRRILLELNIGNMQPYKKLMEEVGLSGSKLNRNGSLTGRRTKRGGKNRVQHYKQGQHQQHPQHPQHQQHYTLQHHTQYAKQPYAPFPQFASQYPQYPIPQELDLYHQQQHQQQQQQHDHAVMQQLQQLSLSSAAMGYNSQPDTPNVTSNNKSLFL